MTGDSTLDSLYEDPVISSINFDGKDVLEIGCGTGGFTLEYLTRANSILGIDPASEAIDRLKAQWPRSLQNSLIDFRPANIVDFPLPRQAFDIAVFSHSF